MSVGGFKPGSNRRYKNKIISWPKQLFLGNKNKKHPLSRERPGVEATFIKAQIRGGSHARKEIEKKNVAVEKT